VGYETDMKETRNVYKSLVAVPEGMKFGNIYTNARIILKCTLRN
jgi:hypothetical protein